MPDNVALKWIKDSKHHSKLLNRWLTILENSNVQLPTDPLSRLQDHEYDVVHRGGRFHANAAGLSRYPHEEVNAFDQRQFFDTTSENFQDEDLELKILKQ